MGDSQFPILCSWFSPSRASAIPSNVFPHTLQNAVDRSSCQASGLRRGRQEERDASSLGMALGVGGDGERGGPGPDAWRRQILDKVVER